MNDERMILTENEKRFLVAYRQAPKEWKVFIENFLAIATEKRDSDIKEILEIMRERNLATPEMLDRVYAILEAQNT